MPPKVPISMIIQEHSSLIYVIPVLYLFKWLDNIDRRRFTRFRDQSALYGGQVKPGEPPSWLPEYRGYQG